MKALALHEAERFPPAYKGIVIEAGRARDLWDPPLGGLIKPAETESHGG